MLQKRGIIMQKGSSWIVLCVFVFVAFLADTAHAALKPTQLNYYDGLVTVDVRDVSRMILLEEIAKAASIDIFIVEGILPKGVMATNIEKPLQELLDSILRDCSYAVIYYPSGHGGGVYVSMPYSAGRGMKNLAGVMHSSVANIEKTGGQFEANNGHNLISEHPGNTEGGEKNSLSTGEATDTKDPSRRAIAYWRRLDSSELAAMPTAGGMQTSSRNYALASGSSGSWASRGVNPADLEPGTNAGQDSPYLRTGEAGLEPYSTLESGSESDPDRRRARLEHWIAELEQRIATGESDRFYDFWATQTDAKYLTHDQIRLEYYLEELAKLDR
jgi:hypothetical protein